MSDTKAIERYLDWRDERENVVHDVSPRAFALEEARMAVVHAAVAWCDSPDDLQVEYADEIFATVREYLELIESDE